ncbi:MAG TPA: GEVED domain-containing protein [Edaphocola sp.]|nr:GEVED domain-containing protein [Edaphocola sp.]
MKKMKAILILMLLSFGWNAQAQTTVSIGGSGTGTSTYWPLYYLYNYSYTQQIVYASEINSGGWGGGNASISKIKFLPTASASTTNWKDWVIYLGNTSKTSFSSSTDWIALGNLTQVFNGTIQANVTANQWLEITLTTPFLWDGSSNLVVAIDENTSTYGNTPSWKGYTTDANKAIYFYSDGTNPNPASPPTASGRNAATTNIAQIQFEMNATAPCAGTPNPGNTVSNVDSVCPNVNFNLSLQNLTSGSGVTYQWESADDAAFTINVTNLGTLGSQATTQTSTKYYRCKVTCSGSSTYSTPKLVVIKSFLDCYCQVTSTSTTYGISNFTTTNGITNINNTSGPGSYSNYSAQSVSQVQGQSINFSITSANSSAGMAIWVDWDNDGSFSSTEKVYNAGTYVTSATGSITVPLTAVAGPHRMRVVANYLSTNPTACDNLGSASYGEAEDYTFMVLAAIPCSGTPTAGTISATATQLYQGQNFTLNAGTTTSFGLGISYQWQSTPAGFNNWTNITGANNMNLAQTMSGNSVSYRLILTCANSSASDTSNVVTVALNAPDYVPVSLIGFDEDVIANGIGAALSSTTNSVDAAPYALVSQDFKATPTSTGPTKFVPANRNIANLAKLFILKDYSQNNSLRRTSNTSGSLKFVTPKKAKQVYVLGVSGSGASTVNATVKFTDGTTQAVTALSWPDWFATTGSVVASQVGRINRNTNALEAGTGPQLFENVLNITAANQIKQIDSITFDVQAGSNIMNFLAISIIPPDTVTCVTPSGLMAANIQDHTATISWSANGATPNNYQLSYGLSGILPGNGTMINVTNDSTQNLVGLTSVTDYDVFVRRNCGGGVYSDWIGPISFETLMENCTGTPNAGIAASTDTLICPSLSFTLNTTGSTLANNISGNWQQSLDGGTTWTNIVGATGISYFVTNGITDTTSYRYHIACTTSNMDTVSNVVVVKVKGFMACYCTPGGSNANYFINSFSTTGAVQNISKLNTGFTPNGYADYTSTDTVIQEQSAVVNFSINGNTSSTYGFSVFVDWNHNGIFEATEKMFGTSAYANSATGNFTVPATALLGATRMRVGLHYLSSTGPSACDNTTYTEFEDYTFVVRTPCVPPVVNLGVDTTICNGNTLTLNAGNSNPNATYLWSNGASTQTILVDTAGTYSVTVTDGLCSVADTITVAVAQNPTIGLGNDTTICVGNTVTLDAGTNTGGTYLWSNGASTQTIVVDTTGSFSVVKTNTAGCSVSDTINVTVSPLPIVNLGNDTTICSGNNVTLNAGSNVGGSYLWSNAATTQTINVTATGTYSVIKTNGAGCKAYDTISVTVNPTPNINLGNDTVICSGNSLVLDAGTNTGGTYLWSTGASTQTITITTTGNYSVLKTNSFGCSKSDTISVTVTQKPIVNLGNDTAICVGTSLTLNAGPNSLTSYLWSNGATTETINVTTAGTYTVTATKTGSVCSTMDTIVVTIIAKPVVNLGNDTTICSGSSIVLNAGVTTGATYLWNTGATTSSINVNTTGTYSVTKTNASGCVKIDTIVVTVAPNPQALLPDTVYFCNGFSATISAGNPGATYLWNTNDTSQSIVVTTAGQYSVKVTNASGCVTRDTTIAVVHPLPIVDLGNDTAICKNDNIVLDAQNAGSTYVWNTGATTQSIIVNQPGNYSVVVTTALGCVSTDDIDIDWFNDATVDGFNFVPRFEINPKRVDFAPINPQDVTNYLWDFGDGVTSTAMEPSHIYANEGFYTVSLTVSNHCGSMDTSLMIHVDIKTGVKAVNSELQIDVFPVPAQNKLSVATLTKDLKLQTIAVYNTLGQEANMIKVMDKSKTDIDISNLPSGNYFLKIETDKGLIMRRFNVVK